MTLLSDARILYQTFVNAFDPGASAILERLPAATQEAWLLVAATARMLDLPAETEASITPGFLYLATWSPYDGWADQKAPGRTQVVFSIPQLKTLFTIEGIKGDLPVFTHVHTLPKTVRRIPGLLYDQPPID